MATCVPWQQSPRRIVLRNRSSVTAMAFCLILLIFGVVVRASSIKESPLSHSVSVSRHLQAIVSSTHNNTVHKRCGINRVITLLFLLLFLQSYCASYIAREQILLQDQPHTIVTENFIGAAQKSTPQVTPILSTMASDLQLE